MSGIAHIIGIRIRIRIRIFGSTTGCCGHRISTTRNRHFGANGRNQLKKPVQCKLRNILGNKE